MKTPNPLPLFHLKSPLGAFIAAFRVATLAEAVARGKVELAKRDRVLGRVRRVAWDGEEVAIDLRKRDRSDYVTPHGRASFWTKDGAWHVALPTPTGMLWTPYAYATRNEAIDAIDEAAEDASEEAYRRERAERAAGWDPTP